MSNLSPVVAPEKTHARRNIAVIVATVLGFVGLGSPAYATTGLLGGAETSFFNSIQGFLTGNLLPLVFVLLAVVVGAAMLIRWGRKAATG